MPNVGASVSLALLDQTRVGILQRVSFSSTVFPARKHGTCCSVATTYWGQSGHASSYSLNSLLSESLMDVPHLLSINPSEISCLGPEHHQDPVYFTASLFLVFSWS